MLFCYKRTDVLRHFIPNDVWTEDMKLQLPTGLTVWTKEKGWGVPTVTSRMPEHGRRRIIRFRSIMERRNRPLSIETVPPLACSTRRRGTLVNELTPHGAMGFGPPPGWIPSTCPFYVEKKRLDRQESGRSRLATSCRNDFSRPITTEVLVNSNGTTGLILGYWYQSGTKSIINFWM